jgi:hypothetical protein
MKKITEGVGIVSFDGVSWCIDPLEDEPEFETQKEWEKWNKKRVYPTDFFPEEVNYGEDRDGILSWKPIKYKIIVEIQEIPRSELLADVGRKK